MPITFNLLLDFDNMSKVCFGEFATESELKSNYG